MRSSMKSVSGVTVLLALMLPLVLAIWSVEVAAAPYQELPPRAGHVPVYIREGNQPLTEIHPGLAEAFHELEGESQNLVEDKSTASKIAAESNKKEETAEAPKSVASPANAGEPKQSSGESDIASFDVVKGDDGEVKAAEQKSDKEA